MIVGITPELGVEIAQLLETTCHDARESFCVEGLEFQVRKHGHIGQGYHAIHHMVPMLYVLTKATRS